MPDLHIGLTGHRPDSLWGYNLNTPQYKRLRADLASLIVRASMKYDTVYCHSGFALGADTLWTQTILSASKRFPNVKLVAEIPIPNQADRWSEQSQREWENALDQADSVNWYADHDLSRPQRRADCCASQGCT